MNDHVRNRWSFPDLGVGVGLRTAHYAHILENRPEVDFFEVLSENYMDTGGRPLGPRAGRRALSDRPPRRVDVHRLDRPVDREHLHKLKSLAARTRALWVSDHLCWTGVAGRNTHDLLPMPLSEEALRHVVAA